MDDCQATDPPSAIIFRILMPIFLDLSANARIQKWRRITLFFLLAAVSIFGWLRLVETIKVYLYLIQLGLNPHPLYFLISGGLIGILFFIAWLTLLLKSSWSTKFIHLCIIFLGVLFLMESMVLSINQSGVFSIGMELFLVIVIYLLPEKSAGSLK
jgi:hypothetical protein